VNQKSNCAGRCTRARAAIPQLPDYRSGPPIPSTRQPRVHIVEANEHRISEHLEVALREIELARAELRCDHGSRRVSTAAEQYLSVKDLAKRIPYSEQTIRNLMSIGELKKGVHWFKPRGRVVFAWSVMEQWVRTQQAQDEEIEPFYPEHNARSRKAR